MKFSLFLLAACLGLAPASAQLPVMSDKSEWLGYFVGWEERGYDFGIGSDGVSLIQPKKRSKRTGKDIKVRYLIQEEVKGKWVRRKFDKEDGLASETEKGVNPKGTVALDMTVTGGTKIRWIHSPTRNGFTITPKIIDKGSKNPLRVGVEFALPRFYRFDKLPSKRELKQRVGKDHLLGIRLKDGKKVRLKFAEPQDDVMSEEFLKEGASSVEVHTGAMADRSFKIANGGEKSGRIDLKTKGELYKSFRMIWMADPQKIGEEGTSVTFEVE